MLENRDAVLFRRRPPSVALKIGNIREQITRFSRTRLAEPLD